MFLHGFISFCQITLAIEINTGNSIGMQKSQREFIDIANINQNPARSTKNLNQISTYVQKK